MVASGEREGNKLVASRVEVATADARRVFEAGQQPLPSGAVVGEIMKRTENILTVHDLTDGQLRPVEVRADAELVIPGIPGPNTVNQLKHHLDIQRMSKSKGNVVNPDELVAQYGADTVRAYLMFGFDWGKGGPWNRRADFRRRALAERRVGDGAGRPARRGHGSGRARGRAQGASGDPQGERQPGTVQLQHGDRRADDAA